VTELAVAYTLAASGGAVQRPLVPTRELPSGRSVAALGQGTWKMGESLRARRAEVAALRRGIELGMTLIDTAEMYADGGAEEVVAEAIAGCREQVFVVSKVLPSNASAAGTVAACERSLRRLGCEVLDLYLLHWRGGQPLASTVEGFERLKTRGLIRDWGVSNFDVDDLDELAALASGADCATNQVYYALSQRGPEFALLPWMAQRAMPAMAYCPLDEGRLVAHPALAPIARRLGVTAAQVALAWLLSRPGVIAIPKSASDARVAENAASAGVALDADDLAALDAAFPPPRRRRPLAMV
jgi:diketogulonate reductase-like aldo/keto reductase